jgi:hypothetical protein
MLIIYAYIVLFITYISCQMKIVASETLSTSATSTSLPPLTIVTIHMNMNTCNHMKLLLESMRWNAPHVHFTLIDVLPSYDAGQNHTVGQLIHEMGINNVHLAPITYDQLSKRLSDKLSIDIKVSTYWKDKLRDFKPLLAHLFPEHVDPVNYKYWGYADIDIIWGNFTAFAHLFHDSPPVVLTGKHRIIICLIA